MLRDLNAGSLAGRARGWVIVIILDLLVAWGLYEFLKPVSKSFYLVAAWLRLVYVVMLSIAVVNFVPVLLLSGDAGYLKIFEPGQTGALVMIFLNAFEGIWSMGLVIFGLHLAAMLVVTGFCYLCLNGLKMFFFRV